VQSLLLAVQVTHRHEGKRQAELIGVTVTALTFTSFPSMDVASSGIQEPFDLIRLSLAERVFVKLVSSALRGDRQLTGVLHVRVLSFLRPNLVE
jgi:hypothetical protein